MASACAILAETGPDMDAFASADHPASWAGLCPGNNESGGKRRSGLPQVADAAEWLQARRDRHSAQDAPRHPFRPAVRHAVPRPGSRPRGADGQAKRAALDPDAPVLRTPLRAGRDGRTIRGGSHALISDEPPRPLCCGTRDRTSMPGHNRGCPKHRIRAAPARDAGRHALRRSIQRPLPLGRMAAFRTGISHQRQLIVRTLACASRLRAFASTPASTQCTECRGDVDLPTLATFGPHSVGRTVPKVLAFEFVVLKCFIAVQGIEGKKVGSRDPSPDLRRNHRYGCRRRRRKGSNDFAV